MSQFIEREPHEFTFEHGLTWAAVLKVDDEPTKRGVIFATGQLVGGPRMEISLDEGPTVALTVVGVEGDEHLVSAPFGAFLRTAVAVFCIVAPTAEGLVRASVLVNNRELATTEFSTDLGTKEMVSSTIGTDLSRTHYAAFTLGALAMYDGAKSQDELASIWAHFNAKFALSNG